jgi:hypothetical protein
MALAALLAVSIVCAGCTQKPVGYKETTEAFVGSVLQDGKPISLPEGSRMDLVHDETYSKFGIPLGQDGSFKIGWMPTGKYSAELVWLKGAASADGGSLERFNVPNGLTIEKDKTEYTMDLGKKWEP